MYALGLSFSLLKCFQEKWASDTCSLFLLSPAFIIREKQAVQARHFGKRGRTQWKQLNFYKINKRHDRLEPEELKMPLNRKLPSSVHWFFEKVKWFIKADFLTMPSNVFFFFFKLEWHVLKGRGHRKTFSIIVIFRLFVFSQRPQQISRKSHCVALIPC